MLFILRHPKVILLKFILLNILENFISKVYNLKIKFHNFVVFNFIKNFYKKS